MTDRRHQQLGMNPSTAQQRLVKDLLFALLIQAGHVCCRCGQALTRETFSIEHKTPWLDSENPLQLFFDLNNIAFSHLSCNSSAARKPTKLPEHERKSRRTTHSREAMRRWYTPEKRRARYERTGN